MALLRQTYDNQVAIFEVKVTARDKPTHRRRWNGGPMASDEANDALYAAVEAFKATLREHGFDAARVGYGVSAREIDNG